jgi:hypothetical protein
MEKVVRITLLGLGYGKKAMNEFCENINYQNLDLKSRKLREIKNRS